MSNKNFKVYQIDDKIAFLNRELEEEVYSKQPDGFPLIEQEHVLCKLKKTLCGLEKTPKAWHERLEMLFL